VPIFAKQREAIRLLVADGLADLDGQEKDARLAEVGVAPNSIPAVKAHITMGTYGEDEREGLFEGACGQVTHDRRERSKKARDASIRIHGYVCAVCKINFQDRYGEIGREFIHVHHISPISGRPGQYKIDPGNDLVPVCPNCHAMLHRSPLHSIHELRLAMERQQSKSG
jgi:5-methylcytosine-specific restriction protein A